MARVNKAIAAVLRESKKESRLVKKKAKGLSSAAIKEAARNSSRAHSSRYSLHFAAVLGGDCARVEKG
jgi:hypothetical protein